MMVPIETTIKTVTQIQTTMKMVEETIHIQNQVPVKQILVMMNNLHKSFFIKFIYFFILFFKHLMQNYSFIENIMKYL